MLKAGFELDCKMKWCDKYHAPVAVTHTLSHLAFITLLVSTILFLTAGSASTGNIAFKVMTYSGVSLVTLLALSLLLNIFYAGMVTTAMRSVHKPMSNTGTFLYLLGKEFGKNVFWMIGGPFVFGYNVKNPYGSRGLFGK